jgi:formyltetrahydrofolate hydrolase
VAIFVSKADHCLLDLLRRRVIRDGNTTVVF